MKDNNKQVEKSDITDANLSVKMRPENRDPVAQKLKEVKMQKSTLNEMASGLANLVTPVSSAAMTSKTKDSKLELENNDPFELNAPSGSATQMDTSTSPEEGSLVTPVSSAAKSKDCKLESENNDPFEFNAPSGSATQMDTSTSPEEESLVTPVSSAAMTSMSKDCKLELKNNDPFELNAPSGSAGQLDTSTSSETTQQLEAQFSENEIQHTTDHNSQVGSKIEVVVGTVAPPEPMETQEVTAADVPQEEPQALQLPVPQQLEHSESPEPQEPEELPNPASAMEYMEPTLLFLHPVGSYGFYASHEEIADEIQPASMRDIGIDDGNLIFLTGGNDQIHYNAADSLHSPIYFLEETTVRYVEDGEGNVQLDMDSVIEYLPEDHDGPVETGVRSARFSSASPVVQASTPPLPVPATGALPDATPEIEALNVEGRMVEPPVVAAPCVSEAPVIGTNGENSEINVDNVGPVADSPSSPEPEVPTGSLTDDEEGKRERQNLDHDNA